MADSAFAELHERLQALITEGESLAGSFHHQLGKDMVWSFIRVAVESLWLLEDRLPSVFDELKSLPWTTILEEEEEAGSSENAYREEHQMTLTDFNYSTLERAVELLRIADFKARMESESCGVGSPAADVTRTAVPGSPTADLPRREPPLTDLLAGSAPLKEEVVAQLLGVEVSTLQRWRVLEKGPAFHKMGRAVRYMPQDIRAYLDRQRSGVKTSR